MLVVAVVDNPPVAPVARKCRYTKRNGRGGDHVFPARTCGPMVAIAILCYDTCFSDEPPDETGSTLEQSWMESGWKPGMETLDGNLGWTLGVIGSTF